MSDERRREAADRLMDGITDLNDDFILAADEKNRDHGKKSINARRTKWAVIGISLAAVMLAGFIALGILLGKEEQTQNGAGQSGEGTVTEAGTQTGTDDPSDPSVIKANVVNLAEGVQQAELTKTPMQDNHRRALSTGAVKLLQKTMEMEGKPNQNYLISPVSLQMALGMLTAGTDDGSETQKELMELLIPGTNATPTVLNAEMATLAGRMQKGTDWNVANSVWVKKDGNVKLTENYISDAVNYYRAELFAAPFDDSTVTDINNWVKENTRERIPKMVEYLDPQTSLVLMNAIAFDGEWRTPVSEYMVRKNANFTNSDGSKSKVTMLQSEEHGYVRIAGGKGFLKAYSGTGYCFLGLLPPEGVTAEEYLKKILAEKKAFSDAILEADFEPTLQVEFPEFKAEYGAEMNDIIKALGVQKAFTGSAEFGKMITEDSERISVDRVVHKAMIEVDRKGTKAAAATEIAVTEAAVMELNPEIIEIKLDRPFIYGIIDLLTGIPVFLGVQNTMK